MATDAEIEYNITRALKFLIAHDTNEGIVARVMEDCKVSRSTARRYIKHAYERLKNNNANDLEGYREQAIEQRNMLAKAALANGDIATALRCDDSRDKLRGLVIDKHEVKNEVAGKIIVDFGHALLSDKKQDEGSDGEEEERA